MEKLLITTNQGYGIDIMKNFAYLILFTALCWITFAKDVYAYIDPATGSYILQLLIAGLLGGLFAIKLFWTKIKTFFAKVFSADKNDEEKINESGENEE